MDWAPPMLTQDEIVNTITSTDTSNFGYSIGELFYNSEMKMLNKYNSLGNGVMQTWILFGDPSIDLKSKIPQNLDFSYKYINNTNELIINSNTDNILLGISENNKYLNSYIINKGITKIIIDSFEESFLLTFTKPNFKTIQNNQFKTNSVFSEKINSINVYPNPIDNSNNKLVIYGINSFNSISLIDVLGNEQKIETQIESNNVFITFENLKSGIYFLNIIDNNYQNIIKRIVIN
jgi:hypothetical protein